MGRWRGEDGITHASREQHSFIRGGIAPRVGRFFPIVDRFGIWVRAGIGAELGSERGSVTRIDESRATSEASTLQRLETIGLSGRLDALLLAQPVGPLLLSGGPSFTTNFTWDARGGSPRTETRLGLHLALGLAF